MRKELFKLQQNYPFLTALWYGRHSVYRLNIKEKKPYHHDNGRSPPSQHFPVKLVQTTTAQANSHTIVTK